MQIDLQILLILVLQISLFSFKQNAIFIRR